MTALSTHPSIAKSPSPSSARRDAVAAYLPLALCVALACFALLPAARGNPRLSWTFLATAGLMAGWFTWLAFDSRRSGRRLEMAFSAPLRAHYIQASLQICIYTYWGMYWPKVFEAAPLIASQMVFLYLFDGLLAWTRGRNWRLGFGPVPIIFSTNLFLWFKDDWFACQFAMIAVCALAKEYLRWERDGKRTHIFNPSAFGLALCSLVLIATNTTHLTWGVEVATTLGLPPHMYTMIFVLGLVVQYYFSVTLITLFAILTLYVLNAMYTGLTGVYHFIDVNIPIAIFLGMHLLVTDPSTSPRTNAGKILFGVLYGLANFALFSLLDGVGVPDFYDKLLPVPILNLCVRAFDRFGSNARLERLGVMGRVLSPRSLNLVHMGSWSALFALMVSTGFVQARHEGESLVFWRQAYEEGKPRAGRSWMRLAGSMAEKGDSAAMNQLGSIYREGKIVPANAEAAAFYFARASAAGNLRGSENVLQHFSMASVAASRESLEFALQHLEREHRQSDDGRSAFLLGQASELGKGLPHDLERARGYFRVAVGHGNRNAAKALTRLAMTGPVQASDLSLAAPVLERACEARDRESMLLLAQMMLLGQGVVRDQSRAQVLLQKACELGDAAACQVLKQRGWN